MSLGKQIFKYMIGSFAYREDDDNLDHPFSESFNADPSDFIIPFGQAYNTYTSGASTDDESCPLASAFRDIDNGYFSIGFQDNGFDADYLGTVDFSDEDIGIVDQNAGKFRVSDLIWSNNSNLKMKVEVGLRNGTIMAMYLKDEDEDDLI